jgi:hypothetical protein
MTLPGVSTASNKSSTTWPITSTGSFTASEPITSPS